MKKFAVLLLVAVLFTVVGCAKKTASEQLRDDMNKAAKKMDKDIKGIM